MICAPFPASNASTVLVTGANGFVGRALVQYLQQSEHHLVRGAVRGLYPERLPPGTNVMVGDLTACTDWSSALDGVDVVVHVAARTHVVVGQSEASLVQFREINTTATLQLAEQANRAGVRRFIFISSIKVLGEISAVGRPLNEEAPYAPADAYGISKMEAELGLLRMSDTIPMEVVIIRPPLVYGPGMQSNFGALVQAVRSGIPLPFALVQNRRSFIAIDNLLDFIVICIEHPMAGNQIFTVSDGEDLSTPDLVRIMGKVFGRKPVLFPISMVGLQFVTSVLGKQAIFQRLCGNLQVDISKARQQLNWNPQISPEEGLQRVLQKKESCEAQV